MTSSFLPPLIVPVERQDMPKVLLEEGAIPEEDVSESACSAPTHPLRRASSVYVGKRILSFGDNSRVWLHRKLRSTPSHGAVRLGFLLQPAGPDAWKVATQDDTVQMVDVRVETRKDSVMEEFAVLQWIAAQKNTNGLHASQVMVGAATDTEQVYCLQPHDPTAMSLAAYVGNEHGNCLAEETARSFFRQIVEGLHSLETLGICHRNINLETLLVVKDKKSGTFDCVISELGTCQYTGQTEALHSVNQIPQFVPPEVWNGETIKSGLDLDVWAAGVVLYTLIGGLLFAAPFPADPLYTAIQKQSADETSAMDLVGKMLRSDPTERLSLKQVQDHPWLQQGY